MPLRRLLALSASAVVVLVVALAVTLLAITSAQHGVASGLGTTVRSVQAAEELQANLSHLHRARTMLALTGDARFAETERAADDGVSSALAAAQRDVTSPREGAALAGVRVAVERYLALRDRFAAEGQTAMEVYRRTQSSVDTASDAIDHFAAINRTEAEAALRRAARWNGRADVLAGGIVLALLVTLGGVAASLRAQLVLPLLALGRVVRMLGRGDRSARPHAVGVHEVRAIGEALNEAQDLSARQREVQLRFLAGVAHDLRNPLSALRLAASAASTPAVGPEEQLARLRALAVRQVDRLDRMVGDLLDAVRIEAGQLELRLAVHDLRATVHDCVALFERTSALHVLGATLPEGAVLVRCDPARLEQVINNLLSNAIKYSPRGGRVEVVLRSDTAGVVLSVADEGIGIAAGERDSLFEPFHRSAATRETIPGVGLGLSVARRIVEAHGGRIEIESREGVGTTVRVHLPSVASEAPATADRAVQLGSAAAPHTA